MRLLHTPIRLPFLTRAAAALALAAALGACSSGISLDEPIEGPLWRLVQLGDRKVDAGGDAARSPQVQFDDSGRVSGSGGCNRLSGAFTREGSRLRLGQLAATRMACADEALNATETQFFQALQTTAAYSLAGPGQLVLLDANGRSLARLQAGAR